MTDMLTVNKHYTLLFKYKMALEVKIIQLHINRRSGVYLIDQAD